MDYLLLTQGWRCYTLSDFTRKKVISSHHSPEKATLIGTFNYYPYRKIKKSKVFIFETGDSTITDRYGNFSFGNIDFSQPLTIYTRESAYVSYKRPIKKHAVKKISDDQIITGIVYDEDNQPVPGAIIIFKNTNSGTITDINGKYSFEKPKGAKEITCSFIGMLTQSQVIDSDTIDSIMDYEDWSLADVVVVGFGSSRRSDITGSVALVEEPSIINPEGTKNDNKNSTIKMANNQQDDFIKNEILENTRKEAFVMVEEMPEFVGGIEKLRSFISRNIIYPESDYNKNDERKAYVRFMVLDNGNIDSVHIVKSSNIEAFDDEAIRIIKGMPSWNPGKQRGTPVNVWYTMALDYKKIPGSVIMNKNLALNKQNFYISREFYSPMYLDTDTSTLRSDFRQTVYWNPDIKTDSSGLAEVSFYNNDNISSFCATVEGFSNTGLIGRNENKFYTQLPFSMSTKLPEYVTFNDLLEIPLTLKNNTSSTISGELLVNAPEAFQLLGKINQTIKIPANSTKTIYLNYQVLPVISKTQFVISFHSNQYSDAFTQPVEVLPKGFLQKKSFSGNELVKNYSVSVKEMVPGSMQAQLSAYPNVLHEMMGGVDGILREPSGCFEQTSSSTYPNILALQFMQETGTLNPQIRERALGLIERGYKRLIGYETAEKGFEWFGRVKPHEGLTGYGLLEFNDMQKVYPAVDKAMVTRTANWLTSQKDGKGNFKRSSIAYHNFGDISNNVHNAYIVYSLTENGITDLQRELQTVYNEAIHTKDAYRLALVAHSSLNLKQSDKAKIVLDLLTKQINGQGFGKLTAEHSVMYSMGNSLQIETASLIMLAMLKTEKPDITLLTNAKDYLIGSRTYGQFGSTQGTVLALKALTEYSKFMRHPQEDGMIEVKIDNQPKISKAYLKTDNGNITIGNFEKYLDNGKHEIQVNFSKTKSPLPYSLNLSWTTLLPFSDEQCNVGLQTTISRQKISVGETVRLKATLLNKTNGGLPFTLVKIGIPSALSVQSWQLKELQEKHVFDYYEIFNNYVVFYFVSLKPNAVIDIPLDLKAEIPGKYEAAASSAYLYYTNEFKTWTKGIRIAINK